MSHRKLERFEQGEAGGGQLEIQEPDPQYQCIRMVQKSFVVPNEFFQLRSTAAN